MIITKVNCSEQSKYVKLSKIELQVKFKVLFGAH